MCLVVEKDDFYSVLLSSIFTISSDDALIVCGDLNGHIGKNSDGFEGIHGGYGYGIRHTEGTRILDMCAATNLVVANLINKLITLSSGGTKTQIDYTLT